mgnify:FL=1
MKAKYIVKVIKEMCEEEVSTNYDKNGNETKEHYDNITDGTDGICEGRLEFALGVIDIIRELKKLPDVKERDNPYIYKPKSELNFATPRDWNKEEKNDDR